MTEPNTPGWALPLFQIIERIDQKLDGHRESIDDHEARLRGIETAQAQLTALAVAQQKLDESLIEVFGRLRNLEKKLWMAVGAITVVGAVLSLVAFNINLN